MLYIGEGLVQTVESAVPEVAHQHIEELDIAQRLNKAFMQRPIRVVGKEREICDSTGGRLGGVRCRYLVKIRNKSAQDKACPANRRAPFQSPYAVDERAPLASFPVIRGRTSPTKNVLKHTA